MPIEDLRFSIVEICALLGLIQCVYILVYMALRAGKWDQALMPFAYFLLLGLAFLGDFAFRFIGELPLYTPLLWAVWLASLPFSVLVIGQITNRPQLPEPRDFLVLILLPLFVGMAFVTAKQHSVCRLALSCSQLSQWVIIYGIISGCIAMLSIWLRRERLIRVRDESDYGRERYWLVLAMLIADAGLLVLALAAVSNDFKLSKTTLTRDLIGLGFVYLAGTVIFRIYPRAVSESREENEKPLSGEDYDLARHIDNLLNKDKVYHESAYGRVDMARELEIAETRLSRIINAYYGKSLPQLLNEYRIADAQYFLSHTNEAIQTIARESGFNSLASFNRVFREVTGQTPSDFRYNSGKTPENDMS